MSFQLYIDSLWASPYAFSAYVALTEKGVPFETLELKRFEDENRKPFYQKPSITGRVPALIHHGFWLAESSAIAEYLEEVLPPPQYPRLFPADIKERAKARMVMAWLRSDFLPIRAERPTSGIFYEAQRATEPLSPEAVIWADRLVTAAEDLITGDHLFKEWCIADPDLALMLGRLIVNGHEVSPKLRRYFETQWRRPSVERWVNKARPDYVHY